MAAIKELRSEIKIPQMWANHKSAFSLDGCSLIWADRLYLLHLLCTTLVFALPVLLSWYSPPVRHTHTHTSSISRAVYSLSDDCLFKHLSSPVYTTTHTYKTHTTGCLCVALSSNGLYGLKIYTWDILFQ